MNQHTQTELLVSNIQWSHLNAKRSSWEKCLLLSTEDEPWQILQLTEIWWKPSTDLSDFYKLSPRLRQCLWQSDASSVQILRINHSTGNQNVLHILREALSYFCFSQQFHTLCTVFLKKGRLEVLGSLFAIVSTTLGWGHLGNWRPPRFSCQATTCNQHYVAQALALALCM